MLSAPFGVTLELLEQPPAMTFLAGNRRKKIATAAMWTKTQNRLLALTLVGSGMAMPLQAQFGEGLQPGQLPGGRNIQGQQMNRQPGMHTRPETYSIPPTAPTASAAAPSSAPQPSAAVPAPVPQSTVNRVSETPSQRATVSYTNGQLSIVATNSSLNQILRDISRAAGITITGGVSEERVFGNYGPGTPAEVLNDLLDGTDSNMLYVQGVGGSKSELVLTTRTGGPTPPNPNASRFEAEDTPPQPPPPPAPTTPPPPTAAQDAPAAADNSSPAASSLPDSSTPAPAATNSSSTGDSSTSSDQSNGAKTPQQIFDELMKLRQRQQNQPHE